MTTFLKPTVNNPDEIISHFPIRFNNFYEPFLRSGEVLLNLFKNGRIFEKAFLSSSDKNLINAYQAVRDEPERLQKMILRYCENNSKAFFENMKQAVGTPSAYIYVNRASSEDGKWRESQFIDRNRQISKDVECIDRCSRYLNRWCQWVFHTDWESALTNANDGDLVWLEPPRIPWTTDGRIDYPVKTKSVSAFSESNYVYLRNYVEQLKKRGCLVYLLHSNVPATVRIFGEPYARLSNGELLYK